MITGILAGDEAVLQLRVSGRRGQTQDIDAVIDTGFTGWLTLPTDLVTSLGLRWHSLGRGTLADGSETAFDIHEGRVVWDSRVRRIRIYVFDAEPLVGIALMRGYELKIQVRRRGPVSI